MVNGRLFISILRRILKITGIVFAVIIFLFGTITWIIFEKKNDWLQNQIQSYLNESQSGQLEIKNVDFKIFRNFPNVTIELDNVDYFEHQDSLRSQNEKPILHAGKLYIAFEIMPLLKEELNIVVVSVSQAELNIIEYEKGILNIDRALAKPGKAKPVVANKKVITQTPAKTKKVDIRPKTPVTAKSVIHVDLQRINFNDVLVTWNSYHTNNPYVVLVKDFDADVAREGKTITASLHISSEVKNININGIPLPEAGLNIFSDLHYDPERKQLSILESELKYEGFSATIFGTYVQSESRILDLQVDASSKSLEFLSFIIKPETLRKNPGILKKGSAYAKGRVYGELKTQPVQFDISFGMKDLELRLPKATGSFQDIGFDGKFTSGSSADFSKAKLEIKNLRGQVPGGYLKGHFTISNFKNPFVSYNLNSRLKLDGYDQIFRMDFIKNLKGKVSIQANFNGLIKEIAKQKMGRYRSSIITLNDLSFIVAKTNIPVSGLSGIIETRDNQTSLKQLSFIYGKDDLKIDATIDNLLYILFFKEKNISASGNLRSGQLYTQDFIVDSLRQAQVKDRLSNLSFDFNITTVSVNANDTVSTSMIDFDIRNLKAGLDKLPDIVMLDTKGRYGRVGGSPTLELYKFHAILPQGQIDVTGDMIIPGSRLVQFNARVKTNRFPWTYIKELFAEIQINKEPKAKNLAVSEMDLITSDLDLSADILTYPFDINKLIVRNSRAQINFPESRTISVDKVDLDLDSLKFIHPKNSGSITGVKSAKCTIDLKQLKIPELNSFDIKMDVMGENDQFLVNFSRVAEVTRKEKGVFYLDVSKGEPQYRLQYDVRQADLEYFIKRFYKSKFMSGKINYLLDLQASGSEWAYIKKNISGNIEITGDTVHLYGIEIDDVISKYNKSQNFNLTDLGAVLVAGPLGLAVTKGSDFVSLARINFDSTKETRINTMYLKWRLENRELITEDVAVATKFNRISFNGRINFAEKSIPGLTIAVVDKNGCSLMDQKLYGKMGALQTGKLNISKTIFGSVINSVNAVAGKDCKQIYSGKVKNPVQ